MYEQTITRQDNAAISTTPPARSFWLQRKCACGGSAGLDGECAECRKKRLSRQSQSAVQAAPESAPLVNDVLRSPSQPLDHETRAFMEPRFGHDFSQVRVHTDAEAVTSARTINARAYTAGNDIVFGPGRYSPETREGKKLLAHELAHTIQQAPVIARETDIIPAPPFETGGPALERALEFELPGRTPRAPTISPPPVPQRAAPPSTCPSQQEARREIRNSGVAAQTEQSMQREINLAQSLSNRAIASSPRLIRRADRAVRGEFGSLLPAGRNLTARGSVSAVSPATFVARRIPNDAAARERIGKAALATAENTLRNLCITSPTDALVQAEVATPIFNRRKINFVRDYEGARIGGQTNFPTVSGVVVPHVTIPNSSRNLGHIIVHEAMHFYIDDTYFRTAQAGQLEDELIEGGAEFLARHVINQRLSNVRAFEINTGTYASERRYVADNLMRGGLSSFSQAYFQGRVGLLGLTPVRPKLALSQPGDPLEQEADRVAEEVMRTPGTRSPDDDVSKNLSSGALLPMGRQRAG